MLRQMKEYPRLVCAVWCIVDVSLSLSLTHSPSFRQAAELCAEKICFLSVPHCPLSSRHLTVLSVKIFFMYTQTQTPPPYCYCEKTSCEKTSLQSLKPKERKENSDVFGV